MEPLIIGGLVAAYACAGGLVGGLVHAHLKRRPKMDSTDAGLVAFLSGAFLPMGVSIAIGIRVSDRAQRRYLRRLAKIDQLESRQTRIEQLERELGMLPDLPAVEESSGI